MVPEECSGGRRSHRVPAGQGYMRNSYVMREHRPQLPGSSVMTSCTGSDKPAILASSERYVNREVFASALPADPGGRYVNSSGRQSQKGRFPKPGYLPVLPAVAWLVQMQGVSVETVGRDLPGAKRKAHKKQGIDGN